MNVLGIETSCDETAAAVVSGGRMVRSNVVYSQVKEHSPYGGVVPEIASRAHVEALPHVIRDALETAQTGWPEIDAIGVTHGPGLASSLLVGLSAAKALALRLGRPLIGVNHLEAHLFSIFLDAGAPAPADAGRIITLLVSGGHTCLVEMEQGRRFRLLGQTLDDAAGEALDKGAKLLNLGYPGGPEIEKAALDGDPGFVEFPRGPNLMKEKHTGGLDPRWCFSFSGVKTALLYYLKDHPAVVAEQKNFSDVCASYQEAVFEALMNRTRRVLDGRRPDAFACVGGVARNRLLRRKLETLSSAFGIPLLLAPPAYCTDNAAMVAALAGYGQGDSAAYTLDVQPNLGLPTA